ncbi:hypothetical protein QMG61_00740 [Cryobacterium sp. PH31-AA6]|uniref:hypothetical protein n=1 Tax=Cryobacterium sp. PH31-AA6 TaxID=3046205 RepID=UPI0024BB8570|nr:hypothetical protein [Cryobacterium sp. PH31-AA6]MDJ0322292.1 hypothetical protein [Cryobacterium sp. PH31-AA6]
MSKRTKKRSIVFASLGIAGLMSIGIVAAQADPGRGSIDPTPAPTFSEPVSDSQVGVSDEDSSAPESGDDADEGTAKSKDTKQKDTKSKDTKSKDTKQKDTKQKDTKQKDTKQKDTKQKDPRQNGSTHAATPAIPATPAHNEDGEHRAATPATPAVPATRTVKDLKDDSKKMADRGSSGHGSDSGSED